jgi:hypothetical protein
VFEKRVLRIFGSEKGEVTRGLRKLHEEPHNLHSSSDTVKMIKSRSMRWAGHVARIGRQMDTNL